MDRVDSFVMGFFIGGLFFCWMIISSCQSFIKDIKKEAIERGYASIIVVDSLEGNTEFRWKDK